VKVAVDVIDQFSIFQNDGYSKKTGETIFTSKVWKDGVVQGTSVNISEIGTSGEYKVSFQPDSIGFWSVQVLVDYNKDIWVGEYDAKVNSTDEMYDVIRRIAGLVHENTFLDNTTYDVNNQLTGMRVRIFDSAANCSAATDGGSETTGLIGTYNLQSVWEGLGTFKTLRQIKQ
jgi:hypothetical protein